MTKKLNTDLIGAELKGSAFFGGVIPKPSVEATDSPTPVKEEKKTYTRLYTPDEETEEDPYKKRRVRRININLFEDQIVTLKKASRRNGTTTSNVIRYLIDEYLN